MSCSAFRGPFLRVPASAALAVAVIWACAGAAQAQIREFPLAPTNPEGNFVAPYFDGYYQNPDSTWTFSFGFMNRNDEDLIEIPLGPNNHIEPAIYDGGQPTSFPVVSYGGFGGPRERGVFGVVVPKDFTGDVWWHLTSPNGYSTKVPGRLVQPGVVIRGAYKLSTGPQAEGSMRPSVRFSVDGPMDIGPKGIYHPETLLTSVGQPLRITAWAEDRAEGRELGNVNMTLWKHQGPEGVEIAFAHLVPEADPTGVLIAPVEPVPLETTDSVELPLKGPTAHQAAFTATFPQPGDYVIRIRIDNFGGDSSAGNMCCWSNGFVRVTVSP